MFASATTTSRNFTPAFRSCQILECLWNVLKACDLLFYPTKGGYLFKISLLLMRYHYRPQRGRVRI